MKKPIALLLLLVVSLAAFAPACVAPRTEGIALFQPAQLAWPDVKSDLEAGYADGVSEGTLTTSAADALRAESPKMEAALEERSADKLRLVPWRTMHPWAERGIDAKLSRGEIGPNVAESFREHLRNFDAIMERLRGVTTR